MNDDGRRREGEGWDHVAWRVERPDGTWILKEAKEGSEADRIEAARREVAVMQLVRGQLPGWAADALHTEGGLTYPRVDGVPLQDLLARDAVGDADRRRLAVTLGRLIRDLARLDPTAAAEPLPVEDEGWAPWFAELPDRVASVRSVVDDATATAIEHFARRPPPPSPDADDLVLCHNDLGGEHVLVDPATLAITGVIDWADAAVGDPAADVGRLLRDLGADHLPDVLEGMAVTGPERSAVQERAWCFARLLAVEDLEYALVHRPELVDVERANLVRLYATLD